MIDEPKVGDTISGTVGEKSENVIIGKNIIQIGSLQVPIWLAGLLVFALLFIIFLMVKPLDGPQVTVEPLKNVDIRSFVSPADYEEMIAANAVVILPVTYINSKQPARNAFLQHQQVTFHLETVRHEFTWQYFINLHPEAECWICILESTSTQSILSGQPFHQEVLFYCDCGPSWQELLNQFVNSTEEKATFTLTSLVDNKKIISECTVDMNHWRTRVVQFIEQNDGQLPGRITMKCI